MYQSYIYVIYVYIICLRSLWNNYLRRVCVCYLDLKQRTSGKLEGLKSLADRFGFKMKKETRVARSDWATVQLTKDQHLLGAYGGYGRSEYQDQHRKI